jgi:hypothetical protein
MIDHLDLPQKSSNSSNRQTAPEGATKKSLSRPRSFLACPYHDAQSPHGLPDVSVEA